MTHQYTPKLFLRQVPNELLKTYFDCHNELTEIPWEDLEETDVDIIFEKWFALPEPRPWEIERDFRMIYELASEEGIRIIIEEARHLQIDLTEALKDRDGFCHKVFWVFLEYPDVFSIASVFDRADHLNGRFWRKRKDMPKKEPDTGKAALKKLGEAISAYYRHHQGRGELCQVDAYCRTGRCHYFFAYPKDYTDTFIGYTSDGVFERRLQQPAFEIIFAYDSQDGTLDLYVRGDKDLKQDIQKIFARCILNEELIPESKNSHPYELNGLKNRNFPFSTDPSDGITEVRVKRLRLSLVGDPKSRIMLEADVKQDRYAIYDLMEQALDARKLPLEMVNVTQTTIQMVFDGINGRTKTLSFNISFPDSCNLKDKPEHLKAKAYLKKWEIARV